MTARYLAVKALVRQEQNGFSNLVLDAELKKTVPPLAPRDAAFAASIFYTALERQNTLDARLAPFLKKPLARLDSPVRAILRAGLAQAAYMQVPLPAAVNESVKLARAFGKTSAAGMVNAVLRRAAAHTLREADYPDPVLRLSVLQNLSVPVAELLWRQYGAEAFALAAAFYDRRPTAVRVNTCKTTPDALADALRAEGCTVTPGGRANSLAVEFPASPAFTAAFRQGWFHVQGEASQLAADSLCAAPGQRVLDLCAAPGGKSLTLAEAMENRGALLSCDAVPGRLPLLEKNFARCGITCARVLQNDGAVFDPALGTFDRVLCDVPCSGLGVLGKKPDIRYRTAEGLSDLTDLQAKILQNAARYLAPGGRLVYSTCTVNQAENQEQIAQFLAKNKNFNVEAPQNPPPGAEVGPCGTLLLPNRTGLDGFFVAVLEKR